jgi:hypothetical protein
MRRLSASMFLILLSGILLVANNRGGDQGKDKNPENLLTAHIEVTRQAYCHLDDESFGAYIHLSVRFTNVSDRAVILSRKLESPFVVRVARDAESAKRNEFLYNPDVLIGPLTEVPPWAPSFGKAPNPKLFVLLAPGANFETVIRSGVVGISNDATKIQAGLLAKGGSYLFQVGVSTWPYDYPFFNFKTSAEELKHRWSKFGDLSTGMVYSDFTPFTLPEHLVNPRCSTKPGHLP